MAVDTGLHRKPGEMWRRQLGLELGLSEIPLCVAQWKNFLGSGVPDPWSGLPFQGWASSL